MNSTQIEECKVNIVRCWGEWAARNIYLGEGVYTLGPDVQVDKLKRMVQTVSDFVWKGQAATVEDISDDGSLEVARRIAARQER
jgi:hypothetical protein